ADLHRPGTSRNSRRGQLGTRRHTRRDDLGGSVRSRLLRSPETHHFARYPMTQTTNPAQSASDAESDVMIRLEGLTKRFPGQRANAVDELTMDIHEGEIVVLVGPSGCGKTTTMKMINRIIEPTSGRIILDGQDVTTADASATSSSRSVCSRTRRSVRTSPQSPNWSVGAPSRCAAESTSCCGWSTWNPTNTVTGSPNSSPAASSSASAWPAPSEPTRR